METRSSGCLCGILPPKLAPMLQDFVCTRRSGLVFCEKDGSQISQREVLKYSLHPILMKLELEQGALLWRQPKFPKRYSTRASGHARTHVSERYKKLLRQREWRLEWAEKVGT